MPEQPVCRDGTCMKGIEDNPELPAYCPEDCGKLAKDTTGLAPSQSDAGGSGSGLAGRTDASEVSGADAGSGSGSGNVGGENPKEYSGVAAGSGSGSGTGSGSGYRYGWGSGSGYYQVSELQGTKGVVVKEKDTDKDLIEVKGIEDADPRLLQMEYRKNDSGSSRGYLIVRNLALGEGEAKTLYLERLDPNSNGVCFSDTDAIESESDVAYSCVHIKCPGQLGAYSCSTKGGYFVISGLKNSGVLEETLPMVSVAVLDANASESGADNASFKITRNGPTDLPVTVRYSLGGTASERDYVLVPETAVIPAGGASAIVEITPIDDSFYEGLETVSLVLWDSNEYYLGFGITAEAKIADNDPSGYDIEAPGPRAWCGDGKCNGIEKCGTCIPDCGACPSKGIPQNQPIGTQPSGAKTPSGSGQPVIEGPGGKNKGFLDGFKIVLPEDFSFLESNPQERMDLIFKVVEVLVGLALISFVFMLIRDQQKPR